MANVENRSLFLVQFQQSAAISPDWRDKGVHPGDFRRSHQSINNLIQQKWYALPEDQRESIKNYIVNLVLEYGAVEGLSKSLHNILSKANSTLVQIVKY